MPTDKAIKDTERKLRLYRRKYLVNDKFAELDESATRIMVNFFLTEVLGYEELVDIVTEYSIKGTYADYVIEVTKSPRGKKKQSMIVEVKARKLSLNASHIRQSVEYGASEGIDWVLLTNGCHLMLYRIIFGKPIKTKKFFDYSLDDLSQIKNAAKDIAYLTKKSILKDEIETAWQRYSELSPSRLASVVYDESFIKLLRYRLRKETGLSFPFPELCDALAKLIKTSVDVDLKKIKMTPKNKPAKILKKKLISKKLTEKTPSKD